MVTSQPEHLYDASGNLIFWTPRKDKPRKERGTKVGDRVKAAPRHKSPAPSKNPDIRDTANVQDRRLLSITKFHKNVVRVETDVPVNNGTPYGGSKHMVFAVAIPTGDGGSPAPIKPPWRKGKYDWDETLDGYPLDHVPAPSKPVKPAIQKHEFTVNTASGRQFTVTAPNAKQAVKLATRESGKRGWGRVVKVRGLVRS